MMDKLALIAVAAAGFAAAGPIAMPYTDGACNNPVKSYHYVHKNETVDSRPFDTGNGVSAGMNVTGQYSFETFKQIHWDMPSSSQSMTPVVYWKMSNLDPTCRVLFMKPFQMEGQSTVPGSVVLNAGNPDECYFADLQPSMQMAFCCGHDDCAPFDVGFSELNPIDPPPNLNNGPAASVSKALKTAVKPNVPAQPKRRTQQGGSISARAMTKKQATPSAGKQCDANDKACLDNAWGKCKATVSGRSVSKPGRQSPAGSQWQTCRDTSPCPIKITNTLTYSSEVSSSQTVSDTTGTESSQSSSQTHTNQVEVTNVDGVSVSVTAGFSAFGFSASTTAGYDHTTTNDHTTTDTEVQGQTSTQSFSQTVANQTGKATTNAKAIAIEQPIMMQPGGHGVVTFTPYYNCWPVEVDCGNPWVYELSNGDKLLKKVFKTEVCQPAMVGDNQVDGEYNMMYANAEAAA